MAGFELNSKMFLYLKIQCLIENFRLTNPQSLESARRNDLLFFQLFTSLKRFYFDNYASDSVIMGKKHK